ncbi:hypothetical protein niasHT_014771 [Heterodera trifolii]|uniref:Uncharacterized protein n=1 Tax=Heterodera trifolii TaxID=157864 RepID=A0ABD2L6N7_9BILA
MNVVIMKVYSPNATARLIFNGKICMHWGNRRKKIAGRLQIIWLNEYNNAATIMPKSENLLYKIWVLVEDIEDPLDVINGTFGLPIPLRDQNLAEVTPANQSPPARRYPIQNRRPVDRLQIDPSRSSYV